MKKWIAWAGCLVVSISPCLAQSSAKAKQRQLLEMQRLLDQKEAEISDFQRQSESLKREMGQIADQDSQSRHKIRVLEDKIRVAEMKKTQLIRRMDTLRLAEDQWQIALHDELNAYFHQTLLDAFSGPSPLPEAFQRAAIFDKLSYVLELHGTQRRTQVLAAQASQQKQALQVKNEAARAERQARQSLYVQKKEDYEATQEKVARTQKEIQELRDSAAALARLLKSLERRSAYRRPESTVWTAPASHSLPWPAEGRIISAFGKQSVPELHTWIINQGIRLATESGAPVRSVKAGKVIFTGPFRSYGRVLIVDHGREFFTIYGNLGQVYKKKGESVAASESLGIAGPSKDGGGGALYFEIRQSGAALDPLALLRGR